MNKIKNKPIAAKIILELNDLNKDSELFLSFSTTLYSQNLIYSTPRELRKKEKSLELSIIFRDKKSFDTWITHREIIKYWQPKFDALLSKPIITLEEKNVIIDLDKVRNCNCQQPAFYVLQGRSLQFVEELTCGSCLGQVSYATIPLKIKIEDWQTKYQRFYLNWLESSFLEEEALAELTNYTKGKLNLEGEKIRQQLATYLELPVYIKCFSAEENLAKKCLICKGEGEAFSLKTSALICKKCATIF